MKHPLGALALIVAIAVPSGAPAAHDGIGPAVGTQDEIARGGGAAREVLRVAAVARGVVEASPTVGPAPVARARLHAGVPLPAGGSPAAAPPLRDALDAYHRVTANVVLSEQQLTDAEAMLRPLPAGARAAIASVVDAMTRARLLRDAAFAGITPEEIAFAFRVGTDGPGSDAEAARAAAIVGRIDSGAMLHAAALVQAAAQAALPALRGVGLASASCLPGNTICVGTEDTDVWTEDVQLLIDGGGDDTYLNNAGGALPSVGFHLMGGCVFGGGTTGKARPNLACTAAPSTICTVDTANRATGRDDLPVISVPGHAEPGSGRGNDGSCGNDARTANVVTSAETIDSDADARGVAVLLDADGNDTYTVPWSHEDPLFDLIEDCYPGEQDRVNTNRDLFQGASLGSIALLWDAGDGNDVYRGRLNVQGSGHVGGVGMLIASGTGNATFWADRLSQGNGIAAGVGALVTTKIGEHRYLLDAPLVYRNEFTPNGRRCSQEGRAGQGEGGFGGVGILWNDTPGGDAVYRAVSHVTTDAHPFAPVLDEHGAPRLVGGGDAQGSGESFPIVDTPGGLVAGYGLLFDRTDGDASTCAPNPDGTMSAGMVAGSTTGTSTDLSSIGDVDATCGTFNIPVELDPVADLGSALQHLLAGAIGMRVVAPA